MSDIRERALRHLEHRQRTVKEMRTYLSDRGYRNDEIDPLIGELISLKYLDDYEYARLYIEYAISKKRGLQRIRLELRKRGVSEEDIENAIEDSIEELEIDELSDAISIARAECSKISELDDKKLGSIVRKLKRRGYSESDIIKAVETLRKELDSYDEF